MKPPFIGTKIIDDVDVSDIFSLINKEVLFSSRWQFRNNASSDEWKEQKEKNVLPIYENLKTRCEARSILQPKIVYGYFECRKQENALLVTPLPENRMKNTQRFDFPRQRQSPHLCIADFFPDNFVIMQLVTVGQKVIVEGVRLYNEKKYSDSFYLKGLAAEAAEALAEYSHRFIRKELGVEMDRGTRFSFGYPSAPQLMDQKKLYELLGASRIGVNLTETCQLVPEYSTSAIISVDKKAAFFRP